MTKNTQARDERGKRASQFRWISSGRVTICPTNLNKYQFSCFSLTNHSEIVEKVKSSTTKPYFRPTTETDQDVDEAVLNVMIRCWAEDPNDRNDFHSLKSIIRKFNKQVEASYIARTINVLQFFSFFSLSSFLFYRRKTNRDLESDNFLDNLLKRNMQYATNLEGLVDERTALYLEEKNHAENLLYQLIPKQVSPFLWLENGWKAISISSMITTHTSQRKKSCREPFTQVVFLSKTTTS